MKNIKRILLSLGLMTVATPAFADEPARIGEVALILDNIMNKVFRAVDTCRDFHVL